jgi:hypothetical protein
MVCPACMTPFLVPSAAKAVRAFDVQPGGDAVTYGMSRYAIREAIYTGALTASARVRHDGGRWELIGGLPEFASVFRLLGGDLAPMAGTRKLAGWKKARAPDSDFTDPPSVDEPGPDASGSMPLPALADPEEEPSVEAPVVRRPPPTLVPVPVGVLPPLPPRKAPPRRSPVLLAAVGAVLAVALVVVLYVLGST